MACGGTTGSHQEHLDALSATAAIRRYTGWMSCFGMDFIMPILMGRAASSVYFEAQVVIQVAKVRTNKPENPVVKGAVQTPTAGVFDYNPGAIDISADTAGALYVRFGVSYKYSSGQSQSSADVELEVAWLQCGELSGGGTWELATSTTSPRYQPVTSMLPALLVQKVKAAVSCTSLTGNFQWRLVYRLAATAKEAPGAWNQVTDGYAPYAAGDINTGDLSVTPGSNMWIQFAIEYISTSGSGQASLAVAIGTRRT